MAIKGFNRPLFEQTLTRTLSPTTPIRAPSQLRGREKLLEDIRRSLVQPGRHIFIHGDRGVGKTSLAQTVGEDASFSWLRQRVNILPHRPQPRTKAYSRG